ncbi:MAG: thiamine phosphate synthase [Acidobacteriota bacterium]|nr:thiamine phosphate synthase [Acidobacteriota bacterium]
MLRYAITDRRQLGPDEGTRRAALLEQAARLAGAGVDFVQLREKDLSPGELAALATEVAHVLRRQEGGGEAPPRLLVNGGIDVALAAYADGVHLTAGGDAPAPGDVRRRYREAGRQPPVVSLSCHRVADVARARAGWESGEGPDLILFGPVFEKRVGERLISEGVGLDVLGEACGAAGSIPVLALGGVAREDVAACLQTGAAGVAAIRMFLL